MNPYKYFYYSPSNSLDIGFLNDVLSYRRPLDTSAVFSILDLDPQLWLKTDYGVYSKSAIEFLPGQSTYLSANDQPELRGGDIDWAWSFWFRPNDVTSETEIIGKGDGLGGSDIGIDFSIRMQNGYIKVGYYDNSNWRRSEVTGIQTSIWQFVAAWWNSTSGTLNISLNNGPIQSIDYSGTPPITTSGGALEFGRYAFGTSNYYDGYLSSVAFLRNRLFTSGELVSIYNGGSGCSYSQLPATLLSESSGNFHYWPLCEASGTRKNQHSDIHLTAFNNPGNVSGHVQVDISSEQIDNSPVSLWVDSTSGCPFETHSLSRRPIYYTNCINGRPAVKFDDVDDALFSNHSFTTPYMITLVERPNFSNGGRYRTIQAVQPNNALISVGRLADEATVYLDGQVTTSGEQTDRLTHISCLQSALSGSTYIYIDGWDYTTFPNQYSNWRQIGFGSREGGWDERANSYVCELIAFTGIIPSNTREQIESYALDKWYDERPLINGLIEYWEMQEVSGNRQGIYGYDLTDNNTVDAWGGPGGGLANAARFYDANDEYLNRTTGISISVTGDFEVAGWVAPADPCGQHGECFRLYNQDSGATLLELWVNWNSSKKFIAWGPNDVFIPDSSATWSASDVFYFVQLRLDASLNKLYMIINRSSTFEVSYTPSTFTINRISFGLGRYPQSFNGKMAGWGIWNRKLTDTEADFLYNKKSYSQIKAYIG